MKIVWTNGCFDVLHRGHIELFKYAKSLGDFLIVGIDSDQKVRADKGLERPINNQDDRIFMLSAINFVDSTVVFHSKEELRSVLSRVSPDIMVIGSDWKGKEVVGQEYAGSVEFFDRLAGYSSTMTINKMREENETGH